jgi:putative ABC transport system permease protein
VRGVGPEYVALKNWNVVKGGMYTNTDVDRATAVCVLGQTVVDQLFGSRDAVGETIRVNNEPCVVVGVLDIKGQSATGQDQDDQFLMPYTTVMKKIKGVPWLDDILMSSMSAAVVDQAEQDIAGLMRQRHHIQPGADDDFNLRHPTEIAEAVKASTQTMEALLAAVASVSLIVGGIGIMNIMLVSVTERTREIGLRQAVGARGRDVLRQFLVEAVILSLIGGAIGIAAGMLGARAIADSFQWPTRVSTNAIAAAFGCSIVIGVFFGYYPARQTSRLDPIEALRFE